MKIAQQFIESRGISFQIERNGTTLTTALGLPNHEESTSKAYIGMLEGTDVETGDWLINPSNERFYIEDKISDFAFGVLQQYKLFYLTESQFKKSHNSESNTTFNIGTAYGSVIGTQSMVNMNYNSSIQNAREQITASPSHDKEELNQIVNLLELIVNNQVPVSKGLFSKFSEVMERNSWITGSVTSVLLGWLTTQIH